jgi:hypothetical protein
MTSNLTYKTLNILAEKHIPKGKHKYLHVNSREIWKDLMMSLIEKEAVTVNSTLLTRCAHNWELLLIQKLSIQN